MAPQQPPLSGATAGTFFPWLGEVGLSGSAKWDLVARRSETHRSAGFLHRYEFVDLDQAYEAAHGKIMDTVAAEGWPAFRERELALLKSAAATSTRDGSAALTLMWARTVSTG